MFLSREVYFFSVPFLSVSTSLIHQPFVSVFCPYRSGELRGPGWEECPGGHSLSISNRSETPKQCEICNYSLVRCTWSPCPLPSHGLVPARPGPPPPPPPTLPGTAVLGQSLHRRPSAGRGIRRGLRFDFTSFSSSWMLSEIRPL
jgi:hypothetical protein